MSAVSMSPSSTLDLKVIKKTPSWHLNLDEMKHYGTPQAWMPEVIADWKSDNLPNFMRGFNQVQKAVEHKLPHFYGSLWVKHITADGDIIDYGLVSLRAVTTAGVNFIANCFAGTSGYEPEAMKYHGIGTGTTAEAAGDTNLVTPITGTDLSPSGTRATGTLEIGSSANIYRTVGVNTLSGTSASKSVTEHGIFNEGTIASGGTLLDRTVFTAVSLAANDSLQTTYDLTFAAGS